MTQKTNRSFDLSAVRTWMTSNITITVPGWAYAAAGLGGFVLLIAALD